MTRIKQTTRQTILHYRDKENTIRRHENLIERKKKGKETKKLRTTTIAMIATTGTTIAKTANEKTTNEKKNCRFQIFETKIN